MEAWQRNLYAMVIVQFVMSVAFSTMTPFLPFFVQQLGVPHGSSVEVWSGLIFSANFLMAAILSPYWGYLSDRLGRKPMVLRSTLAVAVFTAAMGFSQNVYELLAARAIMGALSGFSAAATTLVATQAPRERVGYSLGLLQTGQVSGAVFGPLLGGLLSDWLGSYRYVFWVTGLLAFVATLLVVLMVEEHFVPAQQASKRPSLFRSFASVARERQLLPMFVVLFMGQLGIMSIAPVLTLYTASLLGENHPHLGLLAGSAQAVTGIANAIASPLIGHQSDRIGQKRVLIAALIGAACFLAPQGLVSSYLAFLGLRFGLGLMLGGLLPSANALVSKLAPPSMRGQAFGLTASATFLGNFGGPLLGGFVSSAYGIPTMFLVTAFLLFANACWVLLAVPKLAPSSASSATPVTQPGKHQPQ